ncbi:fibrocystin isoform X1 [Alligator mississippiensis]|uniref:fibrocystin isoform X1 n=1 Tax=Alligator mississippiensis TaxID=8496 RepID=UPI002877B7D3|nr:fibrocystin isoform X1 [Alligator mississippiensis]XP_019346864.2 fibrocystin isoform X1 [Alligator mississippiensis]
MNALIPFFLNVELLLLTVTSAKVFIDPREGSIAGGTWITLRLDDCLGLTSGQLGLWYSTNGSPSEVSLVNPTLPRVVCDVHPLHFDVSTIRCKTRSLLQEGVYHPEVTSNGQVISTSGRMTGDNCTFKFAAAQTPVVYQINPPSGVPGSLIEVYGQVIAGSYETMDFDTDYIDGPVILEAEDDGWISLCSFANKQNRSIYPIQGEHGTGTLKCRVEGNYIGSQNISFSVFNKGKSVVHKDAWLISAKQELFLYQTHPEIVSVFPTSGSLRGGTRLTITGDFFDHPLKVTVAGVPCENEYISPWKIICITGPVDKTRRLSAPQPGNRGLLFEVWDDTVDTGLTEATPGYRWQFVPNASSPAVFLSQAKQPFRSRLCGFFVAPQTNNYTFWILADGKASLYLSLTEDPGSKIKIASLPAGVSQWSEHWEKNWNQSWQPKSQKFELTGGSRYYLEALHHGTAPSTGVKVGIQLHNTWLNPDVINTYHREKHEIQASAHQLPEIQMLTLSGTGWFSLSWDNISSNTISTNATADQVQTVIEELLSVKCDTEPSSAKFLFRNGFENVSDQKDFCTKGYVVSGVEPFCGRFSICSPKYLVRTPPSTLPRYDVTEYTHVCFAHKGYISNTLHVLVSYINTFLRTVKKNLTCHWRTQENSLESWEFTCVDLWRSCVNSSELLLDLQANSTVLLHQIVLLFPEVDEEPSGKFYLDEIIISDRQVTVFQRDPKPAHPGGNIIEAVSVVGSPPIYNVSLLVAGCGGHLPLFSLRGTLPSQGSEEDDSLFASLENANISLRVQRLQTASPPIGGTFQILLPNTVISGVPVHISSHHLHKLLQSSTDNSTARYFNASDFTVTKDSSTCYEAIWTLTWKAKTGDLPNVISVSAENLTGLNPTVAARVVYDGGVFIGPIFGDMLATCNNSTQVVVVVNEVLANCSGSCSFRYCQEATPLVSDVEYLLDDGLHTKVFIRGSGFTEDHQALRILVNDTTCYVTASNRTDLVCQMKMLPVGLYQVMLLVRPYGFALNASTGGDIYLRIEPKLVAVEPSRASEIGGCPVILRGTGFDGISLVLFGSQVCPVNTNNSNSMRIECEVPSRGEDDFNVHVTLIARCQSTVFANVFIYDPSLNPAIVALSRNRSSIAGGQILQIGLSSFAAYTGSDVQVQIGDAAADILGKTAHGLDVVLPGLAAGWYNVSVILNGILIGSNGVESLIQYISEIFNIEPCCGSFLGGTMLTISGTGFSPNPALVSVTIDRQTCDVTYLMEEAIWCRTPPAAGLSHVQSQDISAQVLVFIGSRSTTHTSSLSLQSGDITFTYQRALTPGVSAVEVEMRNGSLHLGIHGLNVTNSLAKLGDSACELKSQHTNKSTTFSQCSLPMNTLEPGIYPIRVLQKQLGYANLTASLQDIRVTPQISTVFPSQGSACGGLVLTISGFALTSQRNSVRVSLGGNYSCEIKSSVYNMIICTLLPRDQSLGAWQLPEAYPVLNVTVTVNGISSICLANCTLHLLEEWTPSVDAVTWEINGTFTDVMLSGQRLVWATDKPVVRMGNQAPCHVTYWNETSVRCWAASVYAGEHALSMPNSRRGQACFRTGSRIVSIAPYVLRFYPQHFGGNGGGRLTIEGAAFQGRSQTSVIIGNHLCLITHATYNAIQCTVPPGHGTKALWLEVNSLSYPLGEISYREEFTPAFLSLLPVVGLLLTVKVSRITAVENMRVSVGDSPCTNVNGNRTTLQCLAPQLPAGEHHIVGHDLLRGWASSNLTFISRLAVTSVHHNFGCLGGGAVHLHGTGFSPESTSVAICDAPCVTLGPVTATDLSCLAPRLDASLAILCSLKHSSEDCQETGATYIKCDIRVTVGTDSVTGPAPYIYLCDDDILPWDQTTGDSSLPYFTGLFFSPKVERDEVLIYNSSCNITMETEAEMECEGANQPITAEITEIRKSWGQNTQRHARLRFCGPWSKSSSWLDGCPPQDGDNVTVERGQTLLLDTITGILNLLHVKGGKLLFGGPGPVGLHAHYILVSDGGKLQVGSPNAPFCCKAHIHLYGSLHTPNFFPFGAKFLAVRNGTLSIHGWVPNVVFTHLKSAAHVNDTRLVLAEPVDWQSGDEVIVSGTGPGDGEWQEEIVTVEAVNNTELYLRSPLRFPHGFEEEQMGGQHLSLSAVVALLSRRIVVQGNVTGERMSHLRMCAAAGVSGDASGCLYKRSEKKLGSQEMGAVVMMQAFQGEESHIRLEGVQFQHVGQAFQQHLSALTIAGTARLTDSYIRGCSVWDSFGRGLGISGTSDLSVDNNVFYNISGHGLLLGGWLEQGNKIRHNILIGLSGTDGLSNLEAVSPAGIYIQAPANQIEGNMVCAAGYGYFFHLSPKRPSQTPVLSFSKNTAHSCTRYGLLVYPEYQPQCANSLGPVLFQSFMAWRNQGGAQIFRSSNLELQNFQIHSCKEFGIDIVESLGNTSVTNSLLLGHLGHKQDASCMSAGLKTPKRRELLVSNTTFMNFDSSMCTAISTCSGCSRGQGGFTVRAERLKFLNSPNQVLFPFPHSAILEDLDGSITEQKGSHLLASLNILATSCVVSANFSQAAASSVCGRDVIFHRMSIGLNEAPDAPYDLTVTDNNNKTTTVNYVSDTLSNLYGWMALLLDKEAYTLTFDNPLFNKQLQYSATFDNFADGNYLLMEHRNLSSTIEVTVLCGTRRGQPLQSLPSHIYHKSCDWFFNRKLGKLTYLVTGEDLIQVTFKEERVSIPAPAPSDGILKWSMPESWSGVGRGWGGYNHSIPAPGEDVIILPNRAVLVDTTLPPLRGLYVLGRLEFPINSSNVLSAACVVVAGGELKVGTFHHPLERGLNLLIFLRASDGIYCDRLDGINVHPGTIGVYGKVQMHSAYPKKSWTHLGADIAPGNERILLADEVDWSHGGNIVISSSSYEPHQAEVVTVKEIRNHSVKIHERLLHRHIGRSHNTEDGRQLPLAAEVGLLTRNIQIKSDTICSGRLLVGRFRNANGVEYAGALQLLNVELLNFGPSHLPAIDFRNVSQGSAVIASSIHQTCGGGIQSVASHGIVLRDNVMFSTVGPGIDLEGQNHSLTRNLIILSKQPEGSPNWVAGVKVNLIDGAYLLGNVVAGSERIAFHIKGQECSLARDQYIENVAHSSLHGVHLYRGDGFQNCTRITGFLSYKNYDYGVMFHLESSVVMDNMTLVDNAVGVLPVVCSSFEQHCLRKEYIKFRNSVIVATSKTFDCIKDRIKPLSGDSTSRDRAPRYPRRGRIGILWPAFASDTSRWPDKPWHKIRNDPSVSGIMTLQEVTFTGFTKSCYSDDMDICIMSNPDSTGIMHPITSEKMRMLHVNEKNKLYFHMLQTSNEYEDMVFPEMRCESSRKALFKDLDGSALGLEPPVSVFPKSDWEWPQFYLHAGIYREDSKCVYKPSTQGYFCKETDHALLILESLEVDADGERPSPVMSVTGSFVESFSASASHSSCCSSGHPQSFYSVLPSNKLTKVCFAGPTPLTMRLHLNSGQSFTRLFLAVFYNEPQSLHVFRQGKYIPSTSSFVSSDAVAGTNYFSFEDNLLYILLHGDEPVEIYTRHSLLIAFTITTTIGEEEQINVVHHLADFLQIGHELVRIVHNGAGSESTLKVISANARKRTRLCPTMTSCMAFHSRDDGENTWAGPTSMRRLRPSGTATSSSVMIIEVGDPPSLVRNSLVSSLSDERLQSLASILIIAHQTGELQDVLDIPTDTLMLMWSASPSPEGCSGRNGSGLTPGSCLYARPYNISVQVQPSDGEMGKELPVQPQIIFLDKQGQRVETLGLPSEPWVVEAYLKGSSKAALKGHTTVEVQHGWACFTDLAVSSSGTDWYLIFTVSSPPGAKFTAESQPFTIFPIAMGEKSNPILAVVLSSVASVVVLGLFVFCWVKKSKSNSTETKTGRANALQAESNIKSSPIHRPNNSTCVQLQCKQEENDRDVAGVEADMEANGKQGSRVGEVKEQHPQTFKAKSLGKMNIVEHQMDSGEKSSMTKKCGDRYEPRARTSPWDSFELQQLGLKEFSEWKDVSQE